MDKEEIVRRLVETYNDRDELHTAYKEKMKEIILIAFCDFQEYANRNEDFDVIKWIENFVEERFRPSKE